MDGFFAAELTRRERRWARRNGRRDGARGIPSMPDELRPRPDRDRTASAVPPQVRTAFVDAARHRADVASTLLAARVLGANRDMVITVYRRAEVVVREHDVDQHLTDAARGRFNLSLNRWREIATECRPFAEAATAHANQLVAHYWMALTRKRLRRFPALRRGTDRHWLPTLRPALVETSPVWTTPDALLLRSFPTDDTPVEAAQTLSRALSIIDPTQRNEPDGGGSGNGRSGYGTFRPGQSPPEQSQSGQSKQWHSEPGQSSPEGVTHDRPVMGAAYGSFPAA